MTSTTHAEASFNTRRGLLGLALAAGLLDVHAQPTPSTTFSGTPTLTPSPASLMPPQLALGPIAAATAIGDTVRLPAALASGLDAGLSIGETKEALVQLYAYAGFPRSLNALTELMKMLEARRQRGIRDAEGAAAGPVPVGTELLEVGTANQTLLIGAPVKEPLFDFAPAIDQFLKTHLFGDIFARDNLDWHSRELVTVAALAAMTGVESQLLSHVRISLNIGLTTAQLQQAGEALGGAGFTEARGRLQASLEKLA